MMKTIVSALAVAVFAAAMAVKPVVVVTDCGNWFDDQLAIIQLATSPDVELKGVVAAQYGAPGTAKRAYDSAQQLLHALGSNAPVWMGSDSPLLDTRTPFDSEGAKRIAALAEQGPIFVLCIAAATDVASAVLMENTKVENLKVFWMGGGPLPKGGRGDFDLANDLNAARVLFNSDVPLTWMPAAGVADKLQLTGKQLSQRFGDIPVVGKVVNDLAEHIGPTKTKLWDLAAAEVFLRPGFGSATTVPTPEITDAYQLIARKTSKGVIVYTSIREDKILAEFERSLKDWAKVQRGG